MVPKSVVPVPLIVFVAPLKITGGVPVRVPPLLAQFPLTVMVLLLPLSVPLANVIFVTASAAPSDAVPEALFIVRL